MKRVFPLATFERMARKLVGPEKEALRDGLRNFNQFLVTGALVPGLGYKKIAESKFEFRVGLKLRVLVKMEGENYYLAFLGNHDDIKRYLKNL